LGDGVEKSSQKSPQDGFDKIYFLINSTCVEIVSVYKIEIIFALCKKTFAIIERIIPSKAIPIILNLCSSSENCSCKKDNNEIFFELIIEIDLSLLDFLDSDNSNVSKILDSISEKKGNWDEDMGGKELEVVNCSGEG
jgi:hypothetical protein